MAIEFRLEVKTNNPFNQARLLAMVNDLRRYENDWALGLIRKARVYPPPTPLQAAGKGYRRTYRFKNNWRHVPSHFVGQDLVTSVSNDTSYGVPVVGDAEGKHQSDFHAQPGRWYLFRNLAESRGFAKGAQAIIDRHIRGVNYLTSIRP